MRNHLVLVSFIALAACGGGGPQTVGSSAPPPAGGSGSAGSSTHSFVNPTEAKTYSAIGGVQSYQYSTDDQVAQGTQYNQLYAGNASTARNSGITVTYDPRDAIFDVKIADTAAGVNQTLRFQDPVHRTDFGGAREPQEGTPNIANKQIQYLEAGSASGQPVYDTTQSTAFPVGNAGASTNNATFFYQKPGTTTKYVTFAGFVRNSTNVVEVTDANDPDVSYLQQNHVLERAAFAYGERTQNNAVPRTGTGTYTGEMLATMVYNPLPDTQSDAPTYFQWINGSATTTVDFAANSFTHSVTGTVFAPQFDIFTSRQFTIQAGATFTASGPGQIDLVNAGGFKGQVASASFTQGGVTTPVNIAGSSIDGAFFGPAAEEVGGGFRIVGGTPDERIDILGTFTGAKP